MNRWPNGISQAKFSAGTFRFIQELKGIKYSNITEFPIQEKLEIKRQCFKIYVYGSS